MDETDNPSATDVTPGVPFCRYALEEVKAACRENRLGSLKWHENADGSPHGSVGRIYVAMPNSDLDLVVQTNNPDRGSFHAFPAADWRHVDHHAQSEFVAIEALLDQAQEVLIKNIALSPYTPDTTLGTEAKCLQHQIGNLSLSNDHMMKRAEAQMQAFTGYTTKIEPLIAGLEALAFQFEDERPVFALTQHVRETVEILQAYKPHLEMLYRSAEDKLDHLTRAEQYCETGNIGNAETYLRNHYPKIDDFVEGAAAHASFEKQFQSAVAATNEATLRVKEVLDLISDPLTEALRRTITDASPKFSPMNEQQKLGHVLDCVSSMQTNRIRPLALTVMPPAQSGSAIPLTARKHITRHVRINKGSDDPSNRER